MKQKKKKGVGSEMRFGVNTAAPFVGLKREEAADSPCSKQVSVLSSFAVDRLRAIHSRVSHKHERVFIRVHIFKCTNQPSGSFARLLARFLVCQYLIRSTNGRETRLAIVQEMADESPLLPDGKLTHVLDLEGEEDLDAVSTAKGMVTRLRATIEVRKYRQVQLIAYGHAAGGYRASRASLCLP